MSITLQDIRTVMEEVVDEKLDKKLREFEVRFEAKIDKKIDDAKEEILSAIGEVINTMTEDTDNRFHEHHLRIAKLEHRVFG